MLKKINLKEFKDLYRKHIIIVREKRIRFYEKANYKIVENMEICLSSVMFNIMILNILGTNIDAKEIANELECFYKNIYKKYGKTLDFYIKLK